ncbi:MAG: hypothetical protein Q7U98_18055 [Methylicorpusculum sp.]|uniref:hypothetical protein n=1 Tax=Methylicorpusculum sp. TaxID=2713644 RepID=UPI0027171D28|nr:hypothetical protein [Methylicorpusculum sp.]MDO8941061.1 hypothetical protein [Methylicorpusculum sp.]MDP2202340.1 hypothetical protein [Methylicorpusculum sp.]
MPTYDRKLGDDPCLWLDSNEPVVESLNDWTENEILHLMEGLLFDSIKSLLDSRSSPATVADVYAWLSNELDTQPFSFYNCCCLTNLDPDRLRPAILKRFKTLILGLPVKFPH